MARVKPGELRKRKHATKLTPEVVDALAAAVERGLGTELAAAASGVSSNAVRLWLDRARRGDGGIYEALLERMNEAVARRSVQLQEVIAAHAAPRPERRSKSGRVLSPAAPGNFRAAVYLLERLDPKVSRGVLGEILEGPVVEGPAAPLPDVIDAEPIGADASDEEVLLDRVRRYRRQIGRAEAAGDHGAVATLTRQERIASDQLRELRRASGRTTSDEGVEDPAKLDEGAFLDQLRGAAEAMPEAHLRAVVDVWLARHRLRLVAAPSGRGYTLEPDGSVRQIGGGGADA